MLQKAKSFFLLIKQRILSKKPSKQSNQKTRICKRCFNQINEATFHNLLFKNVSLCHKCLLELSPVFNEFIIDGIKCINLYWYNEKIQSLLFQYKGCKDYELKDTFFDYYYKWINLKFFNYVVIPAPSTIENDKLRGFNQVIEMCARIKLPTMCIVHKLGNQLQHNLTSKERAQIENSMTIDDVDLSKKRILIIDDVFTTGSTIKSMIKLIKSKNPKQIKVLVMAKTIDLDSR